MKRSTSIWIIVISTVVAAGVVLFVLFQDGGQLGTQVTAPQGIPGDQDADGTTDDLDFCPFDPTDTC